MRPDHLLNYGYTPTAVAALKQITEILRPAESTRRPVRLLDPTCGEGGALAFVANALAEQGAVVETYGVEIAEERYREALKNLDHVLHTNVVNNFSFTKGAWSLVFLNPPYDNTGGDNSVEKTAIRRGMAALAKGGVAVLVVPRRLLPWLGRFHMTWLALFPTNDPVSPNQVVLIGRKVGNAPTPIPEMGTKPDTPIPVPPSPFDTLTFRVAVVLDGHFRRAAKAIPWPSRLLYGSESAGQLTTLHPVGAGHKAMLLIAHRATVRMSDGSWVRVTSEMVETTAKKEETAGGKKKMVTVTTRQPVARVYRLAEGDLEKLPLASIADYADEIARAIQLRTYALTDDAGAPALAPWEEKVLDTVGRRLPRLGTHQGLFPAQALRAVAMERALLAGEKAVFGLMEMGYGKTPISLTVLALVKARRKVGLTVVMSPPHLVAKWEREAKRLHPDAAVIRPRGSGEKRMREVSRAIALARRKPVILVLSREAMKLGPVHKVQLVPKTLRLGEGPKKYWVCPHCFEPAVTKPPSEDDEEDLDFTPTWVSLDEVSTPPARFKGKKCPHCGKPYAAPENNARSRRWPLADIIARAVKRGEVPGGLFLIVDEVHEYRNTSLQGIAFSRLLRAAKWAVLLTGTLFNGKASDLYNLLRWTSPEFRAEGLTRKQFVDAYGYSESVKEVQEDRTYGRSTKKVQFHERPGVSPLVYRFLFPRTAFGSLRDMAKALPGYTETEKVLADAPTRFRKQEGGEIYHKNGQAAFMEWLRAALGYNNIAAVQPSDDAGHHVYGYWESDEDGNRLRFNEVKILPVLPADTRLPKEEWLLDVVRQQRARGRKVVLLVEQTQKRPLAKRLADLLNNAGFRAVVLDTARVKASEREEWIEKNAHRMDVLIAHPKSVETGLDLVMFQTAVVYEATYNIITLLQALRRIHRLGQTKAVEVYIPQYSGTLEPAAWSVIHRGIAWAVSVYGDFVADQTDPNLSLLSALAEQLQTGQPVDTTPPETVTLSGFNAEELTTRREPEKLTPDLPAETPEPVVPPPAPSAFADLPLFAAATGKEEAAAQAEAARQERKETWERASQEAVQLSLF